MAITSLHNTLKLNTERITNHFEAQVSTLIKKGKEKTNVSVVFEFDFSFHGKDNEGQLIYRMQITNRFLLNGKGAIVKKPSKAQKTALLVAGLNDKLEMQVSEEFKLIKVTNIEGIQKKWEQIKPDILTELPDAKQMVEDFTWQLEEENIQQIFKEDNFLNFFFAGVFDQKYESRKTYVKERVINNALGNVVVPVKEEHKLLPSKKRVSNSAAIELSGKIDTEHDQFSLPRLNNFLGQVAQKGDQHDLEFEYSGTYQLDIQKGLIHSGNLKYIFNLGTVYNNETTITFNMLKDE